jgi:restriction system protein
MAKDSTDKWAYIDAEIAELRNNTQLHPQQFEIILGNVLEPLLKHDGYDLELLAGGQDPGIDFRARPTHVQAAGEQGPTVGIEAKYYRDSSRRVPMNAVQALIGAALTQGLGRALLVTNARFSQQAQDTVARALPLQIELIDVAGLEQWVSRLREEKPDVETEVSVLMRELSSKLAHLIASAPSALAELEWRDLERVVAEVFSGLGFGVTLTPVSKDGGKDVILTCSVRGKRAEYYVEVKHWRSSTRVGQSAVEKLLKVVVEEHKDGGLFLSTYGFTENAFEQLTTIDRQKLKFGDQERIVSCCQTYVKARAGLWAPPENLAEIISFG